MGKETIFLDIFSGYFSIKLRRDNSPFYFGVLSNLFSEDYRHDTPIEQSSVLCGVSWYQSRNPSSWCCFISFNGWWTWWSWWSPWAGSDRASPALWSQHRGRYVDWGSIETNCRANPTPTAYFAIGGCRSKPRPPNEAWIFEKQNSSDSRSPIEARICELHRLFFSPPPSQHLQRQCFSFTSPPAERQPFERLE